MNTTTTPAAMSAEEAQDSVNADYMLLINENKSLHQEVLELEAKIKTLSQPHPVQEGERLADWSATADELYEDIETLLCKLMPPEQHGENEDCEVLLLHADELRRMAKKFKSIAAPASQPIAGSGKEGVSKATEMGIEPPPIPTETEQEFYTLAHQVSQEVEEQSGFWRTCSGCHESEDGYDGGRYLYSKLLQCTIGSGCRECGGLGAVWDDTDYDAMARHMEAATPAQEVGEAGERTGKTQHGHQTKSLKVVPSYEHLVTPEMWPLTYCRSEYDQQIPRIEALGIRTNNQMFEQCVNALLFLLERKPATPAQGVGEAGEPKAETFLHQLRRLSVQRAVVGFKTYENQPITYWTTAIIGEFGEFCNMIKKLKRAENGGHDSGHSYTAKDITPKMLREEIGGTLIYIDLLCSFLEIDLEEAIIETFNEKSIELGFPFLLDKQNTTPPAQQVYTVEPTPPELLEYVINGYRCLAPIEKGVKKISKYGGSVFVTFNSGKTYRLNFQLYDSQVTLDQVSQPAPPSPEKSVPSVNRIVKLYRSYKNYNPIGFQDDLQKLFDSQPPPEEAEREVEQYIFLKTYVDQWFENAPPIEKGSILSKVNEEWQATSPAGYRYEAIFHSLDSFIERGYITLYKQSTQKP